MKMKDLETGMEVAVSGRYGRNDRAVVMSTQPYRWTGYTWKRGVAAPTKSVTDNGAGVAVLVARRINYADNTQVSWFPEIVKPNALRPWSEYQAERAAGEARAKAESIRREQAAQALRNRKESLETRLQTLLGLADVRVRVDLNGEATLAVPTLEMLITMSETLAKASVR